MTAHWLLRIGSRGLRTLAKPSPATEKLACVTYCESNEHWTGLPPEAGAKLRAELVEREPILLSLAAGERVVYAGLLGAALLLKDTANRGVLILPSDWVCDSQDELDARASGAPMTAALAFALMPDAPPRTSFSSASRLDGPVAWSQDAAAARAFVDQVDRLVRLGADACVERAALAAIAAAKAHAFRQRCLITVENLLAWQDAAPAAVRRACVQAEAPAGSGFRWQAAAFSGLSGRNAAVRRRLRAALAARSDVADPFAGDADPLSEIEQKLLRRFLVAAPRTPRAWREPFVRWMLDSDEGLGKLSRLEHALYRERTDLHNAFPRRPASLPSRMRRWLLDKGLQDLGLRLIAREHLARPRAAAGVALRRCDVHVIGYLDAAIGLGTSARNHRDALETAGVRTAATAVPLSGPAQPLRPIPTDCKASLFVINGNHIGSALRYVDDATLRRSWRIGLWAWELPSVPRHTLRGLKHVDELWVPSAFVREAFRRHTAKPIHVVPHPVRASDADIVGFDHLLPAEPYFFFAFDYYSAVERKNPEGVIAAFSAAFAPGSGPQLLIKSRNAHAYGERHERLLELALRRDDIHLVAETWPEALVHRAIRRSLAVVSLHRAEGFGLLTAEAMALGKPTIATAYSGNLEYQNESNAFLVRYSMTQVPPGCRQYEAGGAWAEPDIEDAARAMRTVFNGGPEVEARARRGALTVGEHLAPEVIGQRMKSLLDARLERDDSFARHWRRIFNV